MSRKRNIASAETDPELSEPEPEVMPDETPDPEPEPEVLDAEPSEPSEPSGPSGPKRGRRSVEDARVYELVGQSWLRRRLRNAETATGLNIRRCTRAKAGLLERQGLIREIKV